MAEPKTLTPADLNDLRRRRAALQLANDTLLMVRESFNAHLDFLAGHYGLKMPVTVDFAKGVIQEAEKKKKHDG